MIDIKWDEKFIVDHERIDQEHQIFLGLIKSVSFAVDNDETKEKVLRILVEIKKYADFPEYDEHKKEHQLLLARLEGQIHDYRSGDSNLDELVEFVFQWFALHTTGIDKRLATHIKNNTLA